MTLYVREGRRLVGAVQKYKTVFQVGTQQRSMAMNRIACELIRTGGLGKFSKCRPYVIRALALRPPNVGPAEPVPAGLDWDMWLNQAAWRPFNKRGRRRSRL